MTISQSSVSYPLAMSAYATSSPSMEQTRWYLIRPPSLACTCRKETSCDSVAAYSLTGTLTRPKDTDPFQIARMLIPPAVVDLWRPVSGTAARHAPARAGRRAGAACQTGRMRPMLASKGTTVPTGPEWVHEVKWDGVRILADVADGRVRMFTRNGNDATVAWPDL